MNILSLFDGMGCAAIALERQGFKIDNYFAAEIDKHAIKVTSTKFPNHKHLGSVTDISANDLPKIDIVLGGSPCQGFSFSGKGLNFNDPRSALFFEFVRLLEECRSKNPNVLFLLENVRMKKEHEDVISKILNIQPININSALVSAQNRERLYWTNIAMKKRGLFDDNYCSIPQPKDRFIFLKHILQPASEVDSKYYLSEAALKGMEKHKLRHEDAGNGFGAVIKTPEEKAPTILARYYKGGGECLINDNSELEEWGCIRFGRNDEAKYIRKKSMRMGKDYSPFQQKEIVGIDYQKMNTIVTGSSKDNLLKNKRSGRIRRLTPLECSRLQTVPDDYFFDNTCGGQICSDTQIYKMCGNGWTVDVIAWILSFI